MIAPGPVAKLADFDATMPFGARMRQVRGTRDIHPPEYLKPLSTSQGGLPQAYVIDGSADVWAVGLLLHVSIFGRYAWDVADMSDARYARFRRKGQSSFPVNTPVSLVNAFADALAEDVASRSTMVSPSPFFFSLNFLSSLVYICFAFSLPTFLLPIIIIAIDCLARHD
jgi:hypothetical protein